MFCSVNQIDDLQSSNKKSHGPSVFRDINYSLFHFIWSQIFLRNQLLKLDLLSALKWPCSRVSWDQFSEKRTWVKFILILEIPKIYKRSNFQSKVSLEYRLTVGKTNAIGWSPLTTDSLCSLMTTEDVLELLPRLFDPCLTLKLKLIENYTYLGLDFLHIFPLISVRT